MNLTCDPCLRGEPRRCKGPGCANWKTGAPKFKKPKKVEKAAPRKRKGRPSGQRNRKAPDVRKVSPLRKERVRYGARIPSGKAHAVALDLLFTYDSKRRIAERHGIKYEQVRTVLRNLDSLAELHPQPAEIEEILSRA